MVILVESPYAGDIQRNSEYARRAMLHVIEQGHTPIVPHLLYPQVLDDSDPLQRERALEMCAELREQAEEVWFFIDYGMSSGMLRARDELEFTVALVRAGSRSFKEVVTKRIEIGENPPPRAYQTLPLEQQLEIERADRRAMSKQLARTESTLMDCRHKLWALKNEGMQ